MDWMNYIFKNWTAFVLLIAGILAVIGTFFSSSQDSAQKDNIENLGKENKKLAEKIAALDVINNEITTRIESLSRENKVTVVENLVLSKRSQDLISNVESLSIQVKELLTKVDARVTQDASENLQTGGVLLGFHKSASQSVTFVIGGAMTRNSIEAYRNGARPFRVRGVPIFEIEFEGDEMFINCKVFDFNSNLIAEIERNFWRPNPNYVSKRNYDDHGFEVFDNQGNIAMSLNVEKGIIYLQGVFIRPGHSAVVAGRDQLWMIGSYDEDHIRQHINSIGMEQLFEYNTNDWLHKRRSK